MGENTMNVEEKVQQLQLIEQNIQQLLVQKQSVQSQLVEVESALEELEGSEESWKMIGSIMVKKDPEELKESMQEKKETLELRISSVEKQEDKLREKAQGIQQEVMAQMKKDEGK